MINFTGDRDDTYGRQPSVNEEIRLAKLSSNEKNIFGTQDVYVPLVVHQSKDNL